MATNIHDLTNRASIPTQAQGFPALLDKFKGEIARALPKHLTADRMARIALTAFRLNPKLGECDPRSVFAAVIQSAQLGLEIGIQGQAYLVPYEKRAKVQGQWKTVGVECQFIPGWKGLVDLTNRTGRATTWTGAVFDGDFFEYALGDSPFIKHIPEGEDDPEKMTHVYAVGRVRNSEWPVIEVWPVRRVWKHRDRFNKVGKKHYSFENPEMYARKVVLLQVLKYMPSSPELATAAALSDAAETGAQGLTVKDAIDGTWVPAEQEPEGEPEAGTAEATEESRGTDRIDFAAKVREAGSEDEVRDWQEAARDALNEKAQAELAEIAEARIQELSGTDDAPSAAGLFSR